MAKPSSETQWINTPAVKAFIGGIVTSVACNLAIPISKRFEQSNGNVSLLGDLLYFLPPIVIFLGVAWITNLVLRKYGFEGFKIYEEWGDRAFPAFLAGVIFYLIVSMTIIIASRIISRTIF